MGCGSSVAANGTSDAAQGGAVAPSHGKGGHGNGISPAPVSQNGHNTDPALAGMPNGKPPMITAPSTPTHVNLHVVTGATPTAATPQAGHVPPSQQSSLPPPVSTVPPSVPTAIASSSGTGPGPASGNLRAAAAANAAAGVVSARSRVPPPPSPKMDPTSRTIVIFTINDVYLVDHMPKVRSHILRRLASKKYNQSYITLPGDFLGPSPLSAFDNGSHMV